METRTIDPYEFFRLPAYIQEEALLDMDLVSISNLCDAADLLSEEDSSSKPFQNFCKSANFWRKKCVTNFPGEECSTSCELRIKNDDPDYWMDTYISTYDEVLGQKLRQAVSESDIPKVKDCLDMNVYVDAEDEEGNTALMYASGVGNEEALKMLLQAGADLNLRNSDGETALFWCLWGFEPENLPSTLDTFQQLLLSGADLNVKNNVDVTVSDIIKDLGYDQFYENKNHFENSDRSMAPKVPDNVVDKELYAKIRNKVKNRVKVWPSAYASGQLVSEYKKAGGRYKGKKAKGDDAPLGRWYKEKWVNVCKPKGKGYEKCGRKKSSMKNYPYCRPSVRVSDKTPKTVGELKKEKGQAGLDRICKKKQTSGTPRKGSPRRVEKA